MKSKGRIGIFTCFCLLLSWAATPSVLPAQNIQVTSANPPAAPQGTINLNVAIGGNGFKKGAKAAFHLSGTPDPDGVTVNSTTFNTSSQLTANINISDTTNIANFDIVVTNADGRTGKGSQLFSVTAKGTPVGCTTLGTPSGFSLVAALNNSNSSGGAQYGPALGTAMQVRPVVLTAGTSSRTVLVAAVGEGGNNNQSGKLEIFILDPVTGQVLDGTVIVGTQVQPHITVTYDPTANIGIRVMAAGDVNADGVPDFVAGSRFNNIAYVFIGSVDANGVLSYNFVTLNAPASNPGLFGAGVAMGKLGGSFVGDQVVVGASGSGSGGNAKPGVVYVYGYNGSGFVLDGTLNDPANTNESFGFGVAVADVTGDGAADLVVGASNATANGVKGAGQVYVFPAPLSSPTFYYVLSTGVSGDGIGTKVGTGNIDGHTDVIASASSPAGVVLFDGPIAGNRQSASLRFIADPRLTTTGWATNADFGDMLGTGAGAVVIGAPNVANSNACNVSVGAAELYLPSTTNLSPPAFTFQPPSVQDSYMGFGWGVGILPAVSGVTGYTPLLLSGEIGANVGSTSGAGQVYIYKQN